MPNHIDAQEKQDLQRPPFSRIASAARQYWTVLYKDYGVHRLSGRASFGGTRSVWAELSYGARDRRIVLRARLAELSAAISRHSVAELSAIDSVHFGARVIWDPETGAVFARASCRCPRDPQEIGEAVSFLFADFASLLGDERLLAVLKSASGSLCGTDLDESCDDRNTPVEFARAAHKDRRF